MHFSTQFQCYIAEIYLPNTKYSKTGMIVSEVCCEDTVQIQ